MSQAPPMPAQDGVTEPPEDGGGVEVPLSFWRRRWVQDVLPWITSVTLHVTLLTIAILTFTAVKLVRNIQEQVIIPDATLVSDPGGIPNPGMNDDPAHPTGQQLDPTITETSGLSQKRSDLNTSLMNMPIDSSNDKGGALIDTGTDAAGKSAVRGPTDLAAGALAQFGNPGGGGIGPQGKVFGHGGNAMRIIFVCDASGSMLTKMDLLRLELDKSVDRLLPVQAFNVVFFQDSAHNPRSYLSLSDDLVMATADNKKALYSFLQDIEGQGSTHVIPALRAAFHMQTKPELVYLLTDGAFEDEGGPAVVAAIDQLNADRKVKINPILFLGSEIDPDELKDAAGTMKTIADENGGVFTQVSVSELGY
jgi:von Willebrand factor type A domain